MSAEQFEKSEEIKYVKWVQALTADAAPDVEADVESDVDSDASESQTASDVDASDSGSTDAEENIAIANKFAALASEN